jgi:hypothetical protein
MGAFLEMSDSAAKVLNPATNIAMSSMVKLGTGTPKDSVYKDSAALNTANNATLEDVKAASLVAGMQQSKDPKAR